MIQLGCRKKALHVSRFEWMRGRANGKIKINFNTNYWFWWLSLYGLKGRIDELNFTTRMHCNGGKTNKPPPIRPFVIVICVLCPAAVHSIAVAWQKNERRALQRPVHQAKSRQAVNKKLLRNKMLHVINSFQWRRAHRFRFLFGMAFCCRLVLTAADRRGQPKHIKSEPFVMFVKTTSEASEQCHWWVSWRAASPSPLQDVNGLSGHIVLRSDFHPFLFRLKETARMAGKSLDSTALARPLQRYLSNVMKTLWFRCEMSRQMEFLLFDASAISLCVFLACARKLPIKKSQFFLSAHSANTRGNF